MSGGYYFVKLYGNNNKLKLNLSQRQQISISWDISSTNGWIFKFTSPLTKIKKNPI